MISSSDLSWKLATRFIAGETLEDAVRVVTSLNLKGINATLDHLGEYTQNKVDAYRAVSNIIEIFDMISSTKVQSSVSIKLSQIGLELDEEFCADNLSKILRHACQLGNFLRIDMEDSSTVNATLRLYHRMRAEFGYENVGVVIQSYLYRSANDVHELLKSGTRIRLCKGAYNEPAEIAFPKKTDVDSNFDFICQELLDYAKLFNAIRLSDNGLIPPVPAIATHDVNRIEFAKSYAQILDLPKDSFEFQMLYGIRRDLQEQLIAEGYKVRTYVPYGTQWYPYFMRRLAERPANVWFLLSNYFRDL